MGDGSVGTWVLGKSSLLEGSDDRRAHWLQPKWAEEGVGPYVAAARAEPYGLCDIHARRQSIAHGMIGFSRAILRSAKASSPIGLASEGRIMLTKLTQVVSLIKNGSWSN